MTENDYTYECQVCGRKSSSQWEIAKCELRHTWEKAKALLGFGGDRDGK